jgi:hypothetical protein
MPFRSSNFAHAIARFQNLTQLAIRFFKKLVVKLLLKNKTKGGSMLLFVAAVVLIAVSAVVLRFVVKVYEWHLDMLYGSYLRRVGGSEFR